MQYFNHSLAVCFTFKRNRLQEAMVATLIN